MHAIILIPPDLSLDSPYARECISYVLNRGDQLAAIVRDWNDVDVISPAQTVIVARSVYPGSECATQRITPLGRTANSRSDRYPKQTPAQRFLNATAERWSNEFTAWLLPGE